MEHRYIHKSSFRKRRKFGLRHVVVPAAVICLTLGVMTAIGGSRDEASASAVDAAAAVVERTAQPAEQASLSLRDVFTAQPPSAPVDAAGEEDAFIDDTAMTDKMDELAKMEPAAGGAFGVPVPEQKPSFLVEASLPQGPQIPIPARKPIISDDIREAFAAYLPNFGGAKKKTGPAYKASEITVGKGDTLMKLLTEKAGVDRGEAYNAIETLSTLYDPRKLNVGHTVTVFRDTTGAANRFMGIKIDRDIVNSVYVKRGEDGSFMTGEIEKKVNRTLKRANGVINSSLYLAADSAGVPPAVLVELIRIYSWSVDFQRDIRTGDAFEVMYEQYTTEDGLVVPGKGDILYGKLTLRGDPLPLYLYKDGNGDVDYYDRNGASARKTLMSTPVDGARISSGYGKRRHPVLGYTKMHKGIDFAAPRGTPIYAAGDGTIEYIGRFSSYGNYVRIRHINGLKTAYAHMKGFKSGLHKGSRVKQGDVIGYIGTTGRSTGPHLHYEVHMNGTQVNPRSLKLPKGRELKGAELANFRNALTKLDAQFAALQRGGVTNVATRAR